ncbi:MAG: hypothetical protein IKW35_07620 [Paludibacteraceae bacterium]|nr:hypothetical protein [Paludibacteraceae bacterium]
MRRIRKNLFQRLIACERRREILYKYDLNGEVRENYRGIHGVRYLAKRGFSENFRELRVSEGIRKIMKWLYG